MAGDVATTGTAAADVTQSAPGPEESSVPGEDTEVTRDVAAPRRARPAPPPSPRRLPPRRRPPRRPQPAHLPRPQPPAPAAPSGISSGGAGVRRRLARLGAPRGGGINPVLEPLIKTVRATHPKADIRLVARAYEVAAQWHAGQMRKSGDPYITHPLAVTTILAELGMNTDTLCAALLHDTVEDTPYTLAELRKEFGEEVATLVDGVTKLDRVKYGEAAEAETVRKMVVAMSRDIRVLLIKLADRLHNMRTLRYLAREKQERKSREVLEIYAPLAHRLGMNNIKWELEDLAFATLYPKRYDEIARMVSERAPERELFLQDVVEQVRADLHDAKIKEKVTGRPKHYYSIYQKMIARNVGFDEIYDLVGIRVLVDSVRDCYAALGSIHARWNPIPGRFKDYIAMPKFNMYQSLHTTVIGPEGKPVELQIRTWGMHRRAEYGVAAHWKYKEESLVPGNAGPGVRRQRHGLAPATGRLAAGDGGPGRVPRVAAVRPRHGRGLRLHPQGPGDRAAPGRDPGGFRLRDPHRGRAPVHRRPRQRPPGRAGKRTRQRRHGRDIHLQGARRRAEPGLAGLRQERPGPQQDQALVLQGTPGSGGRERQERDRARHAQAGTPATAAGDRRRVAGHRHGDALQRPVRTVRGRRRGSRQRPVRGHQAGPVGGRGRGRAGRPRRDGAAHPPATAESRYTTPAWSSRGRTDVWARLSRCCTPVPGDEITGFVTRGHGVSVHRADCTNLRHLLDSEPERLVAVRWSPTEDSLFLVGIQVEALDRTGLLSDVTRSLSDQHVNILSASVTTTRDRVAVSKFTFEMGDPKHLGPRAACRARHRRRLRRLPRHELTRQPSPLR